MSFKQLNGANVTPVCVRLCQRKASTANSARSLQPGGRVRQRRFEHHNKKASYRKQMACPRVQSTLRLNFGSKRLKRWKDGSTVV